MQAVVPDAGGDEVGNLGEGGRGGDVDALEDVWGEGSR